MHREPYFPEMVGIIATYFDDSELRELCFKMGVNYEDLDGTNRKVKIISLVSYMHRHRGLEGIEKLDDTVRQLRPHIGLNFERVVSELFLPTDPRRQHMHHLIAQLRNYYQKLHEWKELHNQLDETINIFGQFAAQVDRLASKGMSVDDVNLLYISWDPVHHRLNKLLMWAEQDIQHIGLPYQVLENGDRTGERWAVDLAGQHEAIRTLLTQELPISEYPFGQGFYRIIQRIIQLIRGYHYQSPEWQDWWRTLRDNTRDLDSKLKVSMFWADKELRKAAERLRDFSREALWDEEYQSF